MPDISLITLIGAAPVSGIVASAYKASRFAALPVPYDTVPPGGAADATATSGNNFGGPGHVSLTVSTFEEYWIAVPSGGHIGWVKSPSPVIPESNVSGLLDDLAAAGLDPSLVHLAGTETITGVKTFTANTIFRSRTQYQEGDGSTSSEPILFLYGTNGLWAGIGIDVVAPIPYRDYVSASRYLSDRTITDGVTTLGSAIITSATAAFVSGDVGRMVRGVGLPAGNVVHGRGVVSLTDGTTRIQSVTNGTTAVLTNTATASGTGLYMELGSLTVGGGGDNTEDLMYWASGGAKSATLAIGNVERVHLREYLVQIVGPGAWWNSQTDYPMGTLLVRGGAGQTGKTFDVQNWALTSLFNVDGGTGIATAAYGLVATVGGITATAGGVTASVDNVSATVGDLLALGSGAAVRSLIGAHTFLEDTANTGNYIHMSPAAGALEVIARGGGVFAIQPDVQMTRGAAFWSHAAVASQPAAPTVLADVIAIIRGCGLSA